MINGCSDLFVEVFGDAGRHAALGGRHGIAAEPMSVEIEGIVAIKP